MLCVYLRVSFKLMYLLIRLIVSIIKLIGMITLNSF